MASGGLTWVKPPSLIANKTDAVAAKLVSTLFNYIAIPGAMDTEGMMKEGAPWTDRTTNARTGLTVRATMNGDYINITAYHTMFYGIFLETKYGGAYAIILPVTREQYPRIMQDMQDVFIGLFS